MLLHPRRPTRSAQETLDRVMEFGGPGPARALAGRARDARQHGDRVLGQGRRRARATRRRSRWIAARRPGRRRRGAARQGRRARPGRRLRTAACTRIDLVARSSPMVAHARRPGPRASRPIPTNGALRRRARRGARSTSPTAARAPPARSDDLDLYARVMSEARRRRPPGRRRRATSTSSSAREAVARLRARSAATSTSSSAPASR